MHPVGPVAIQMDDAFLDRTNKTRAGRSARACAPRKLPYVQSLSDALRFHLRSRNGCAIVFLLISGDTPMPFTSNQIAAIWIAIAVIVVVILVLSYRLIFRHGQTQNAAQALAPRELVERDVYEGQRLFILLLLIVLSMAGVLWISEPTHIDPTATEALAAVLKKMEGLSPGIQACYTVRSTTSSIIIATGFGISMGVTYLFGNFLYRKFRDSVAEEREKFWSGVAGRLNVANGSELSEIVVGFTNYEQVILDRRNLYWSLYLRATLALLVVAVIALLIAVCKIESQAGLPIITGIIAFIIGQGSDVLHGPISPASRPIAPAAPETPKTMDNQPTSTAAAADH